MTRVNKHTARGYSLFIQCSFDSNRNKHEYYKSKGCMKNSFKNLREQVIKIASFERLKMFRITEIEFEIMNIILENIRLLHIYDTKKEWLSSSLHNGSKYDYHLIIKELAEEFERTFECIRENTGGKKLENIKNSNIE